jgi:hypothetical protein
MSAKLPVGENGSMGLGEVVVALWAAIVTLRDKGLKLANLLPSRCQSSNINVRYGHKAIII